jgi:hypothetical protein
MTDHERRAPRLLAAFRWLTKNGGTHRQGSRRGRMAKIQFRQAHVRSIRRTVAHARSKVLRMGHPPQNI